MSDGWTNGKGRTLINIMVHCPKGTMFLKSIDASTYVKDAAILGEIMKGFIEDTKVHECKLLPKLLENLGTRTMTQLTWVHEGYYMCVCVYICIYEIKN